METPFSGPLAAKGTMELKAERRVINGSFSRRHRLALRFLDSVPSGALERVLFGSSRFCIPLQIAVQHFLGGLFDARIEFTGGLLRGRLFECFSGEKYFILGSHYEHTTQMFLQEIVKMGDVVYDVGANAGYTTLLLSTLCGPSGHVFAFEPSELNFSRLRRNIEINHESRVTLVNLAVSDDERFGFLAEMGTGSRLVSGGPHPAVGHSEVRTIRLDDFVYRDGHPAPLVLKIDIEGHAGECLRGAHVILQKARPNVICEVHHDEEFDGVRQALAPYSYRVAEVDSVRRYPRHIVATPCQVLDSARRTHG